MLVSLVDPKSYSWTAVHPGRIARMTGVSKLTSQLVSISLTEFRISSSTSSQPAVISPNLNWLRWSQHSSQTSPEKLVQLSQGGVGVDHRIHPVVAVSGDGDVGVDGRFRRVFVCFGAPFPLSQARPEMSFEVSLCRYLVTA